MVCEWDANGIRLRDSSTLTAVQLYAIESIEEDPAIHGKVSKDRALKVKMRGPLRSLPTLPDLPVCRRRRGRRSTGRSAVASCGGSEGGDGGRIWRCVAVGSFPS